jgi:chemotaxis protein methyltransferase CheR
MIYFDQPTKDALVRRFHEATVEGGYLMVGHAEALNKLNNPYEGVEGVTAAYRKTS